MYIKQLSYVAIQETIVSVISMICFFSLVSDVICISSTYYCYPYYSNNNVVIVIVSMFSFFLEKKRGKELYDHGYLKYV